jgi:hypothetical protein
MDRRYRQTREYSGDAAGEALARVQLYRARMAARSARADDAPERPTSQARGETQARVAADKRDRSQVFDTYGSGELGSGDDSMRQLRREIYFRPDAREL